MMKRAVVAGASAVILFLVGCTGGESEVASVTSSIPTSATTEAPTGRWSHLGPDEYEAKTTADPSPTIESAPEPVYTEPVQTQPAVEELYVVECLDGTPGPALMSDGTTQHSDYCFEAMGGPAYIESERWHSSPDNPALAEYYAEQERLANTPYADGGTCPAYKCGYGHNDQGQRNPSSGEIQALHGCQEGYIDDPELCEAVAWVDNHEY